MLSTVDEKTLSRRNVSITIATVQLLRAAALNLLQYSLFLQVNYRYLYALVSDRSSFILWTKELSDYERDWVTR
jgi:hypothetical protein